MVELVSNELKLIEISIKVDANLGFFDRRHEFAAPIPKGEAAALFKTLNEAGYKTSPFTVKSEADKFTGVIIDWSQHD